MTLTSILPSGAICSNRSSGLPPWASMATRSRAATSILRASFSAKALCEASCRPLAAMPSTVFSLMSYMSPREVSAESSVFRISPSSGMASTSFCNVAVFSLRSVQALRAGSQARMMASDLLFRSCVVSVPAALVRSCAAASEACTAGPSLSSSVMSSAVGSFNSAIFASTRAWRFSASSFSRASRSIRSTRLRLFRTSSRAMPTAVLRIWKSSSLTPFLPCLTSCLHILSKFSSGRSKPNSALA
mmetsp:Transcript_43243/g.123707  ORF Transcript_43243/g.123707 Transcript_43243/m.123707 type:complete len:245 (+) Transcript_43243:752-1486(+)